MTLATKTKTRKCRLCRSPYTPMSTGSEVCSWECGLQLTREREAKALKRKRLEFTRGTRQRKAAIKTQSQWVKEVQVEFNRFIRARDANTPCISCGRYSGAKINAGHYRPTSTHPELRFNEINCHLQCEHCNTYKSGNLADYRRNLITKIGLPLVEWLEGPHQPLKATIEELKWLKKYYKEQTKLIQESRA